MNRRYIFGEFVNAATPLSIDEATAICKKAAALRDQVNRYPVDKVIALLGRVQKIWQDKNSYFYLEAMDKLPKLTGFSAEMIELGMQELVWSLDPDTLQRKLEIETNSIPLQNGEKFCSKTKTMLRYYPLGSIFHVLSGNVFLVGPGSLIEGLITGNLNILKMPSEERFFLPLFLESLKSCDRDGVVSSSIAAIDFSSTQEEVVAIFKNNCDAIVVWGGEQAVQGYRDKLPARTRFILFGPKLSFSVVTKCGVNENGLDTIAREIAKELVIWDQQACTAPQACYVESKATALALMQALKVELEKIQKQYPPGVSNPDAAVEVRKARGVAEVSEGLGLGSIIDSGDDNLNYTLICDDALELEPSPLNRTLRFVPFSRLQDVFSVLRGVRGYLQTIGLAVGKDEWSMMVEELAQLGGLRVLPIGKMALGEIDDPHDGLYDLPQFLNLVVARGVSKELYPFDMQNFEERGLNQSVKLRKLLSSAIKSEFYRNRLDGLNIESIQELHKIPILSRLDWESNMPPHSQRLATTHPEGGYVTRSGGSTGIPKFSFFDKRDWQAMLRSAVKMFEACGFSSDDRIANFMTSGDLYGSFISFNHVNFELGAMSFCFGSATDPRNFLDLVQSFKINAIQGITATLLTVLRSAKQMDPKLQIEKVMFAGMPLNPADREWLKTELRAKLIVSVIGTTEANHIGYQCEHLSGRLHHAPEDYNFIEILNDQGRPVGLGEAGRMVITNLEKLNFPVVRYENGDAAKWTGVPCQCGRADRVFDYLGRRDDVLSIGNMNFDYNDVLNSLKSLDLSHLQLVASFKNGIEHLEVNIELQPGYSASDNTNLVSRIKELMKSKLSGFSEALNAEILSYSIHIYDTNKMTRNERTGKIKSVIDER